MSITQSLNFALTGLNASSRMAEITSANIANAMTDGYGRRVLDLSADVIGLQGAGVRIVGVTRIVDQGLIGERRLSDAILAGQNREATMMGRVEAAVGQPDDPFGLAARLNAFESALINAGGDPASEQRLSLALTRLGDVTRVLKSGADDVQLMRQEADAAIARDVERLNIALAQVERFNTDIGRSRALGQDPSGLIDQRQRAIDTIAEIVPVREVARENGRAALFTPSGEVLIDGPAAVYAFQRVSTITADMTLASGGLFGITRDGQPMSPIDGVGKLAGGSLGASFKLRDDTLVAAQRGLDEIAADLITRFSDPAVDPSLAPGNPGLLTDGGAAYDPLLIDGLANRLDVNAAVDPARGGLLSRWRDGVDAAAVGPVGSADQINRWVDALSSPRTIDPSIPALSASGQVARVTSDIATARLLSEEAQSFASVRRDMLYQAELASGVDTDLELQNLLRVEQAYAANAKVIQTASAMIQSLLEI